MIIHLYDDDSCGYQYEIGDWVKLNRDSGQYPAGTYGKVSDNYWGSSTHWSIRGIRVRVWNEDTNSFIGILVEPVWFFEPLHEPFIVRVVG